MKVLPLWQPWASLVAMGAKRVETRSWAAPATLIGQRIAIHATLTRKELNLCATDPFRRYLPDSVEDLPLGAIVCTLTLDRCSEITESSAAELERQHPHEFAFGNYEPGRFAWVFRDDVEALEEPVPFKASQGINTIDAALLGLPEPQGALV